jgi:uncharacterized protein YidB (DUF937 family)
MINKMTTTEANNSALLEVAEKAKNAADKVVDSLKKAGSPDDGKKAEENVSASRTEKDTEELTRAFNKARLTEVAKKYGLEPDEVIKAYYSAKFVNEEESKTTATVQAN